MKLVEITEMMFPKLKPEELTESEIDLLLGLFHEDGFLAIAREDQVYEISKQELREYLKNRSKP